jgi:hypothetical protein
MMMSVLPVATVPIAAMGHADVINVFFVKRRNQCMSLLWIWTIVQIWIDVPLHWTDACASLEGTSATPYEPEMASKASSPIDHTEKIKMMMASKDNKGKYADDNEEGHFIFLV